MNENIELTYKIPDMSIIIEKGKQKCKDFILNGKWYEWYNDGCPYDDSGDTRPLKVSKVDYVMGLEESEQYPIEQIYIGEWKPAYASGSGKLHIDFAYGLRDNFEDEIITAFVNINMPSNVEKNTEEYDSYKDELREICFNKYYLQTFDMFGDILSYFTKNKILQILNNNLDQTIKQQ